MSYLIVKDLSFSYGHHWSLSNINFSINRGEVFTILGPSGSGKSTLLHIIGGFINPKFGSVLLDNQDITNSPPKKRNIGIVFQSYLLFPHMTVFKNISYPLKRRKWNKHQINEKVKDLLKLTDLEDLIDRLPHELSGGQKQRVALARALSYDPLILLLDEPLGALDKKLRKQMQFEIKQIQSKTGSTILYVTHDQSESMVISDRIAIMNDGKIVQIGTPNELYNNPINPFVADFFGPSNFIDVNVDSLHEHICVLKHNGHQIGNIKKPNWLTGKNIKLSLFIRPENIMLSNKSNNKINEIPCMIHNKYYMGDHLLYHLKLIDGSIIEAKQSIDNENIYNTHDNIFLIIDPDKVKLFKH